MIWSIVNKIIHQYYFQNETIDDLFQIGCIGFLKAVRGFKPEKNFKFISYLHKWVAGEIMHYYRRAYRLQRKHNAFTVKIYSYDTFLNEGADDDRPTTFYDLLHYEVNFDACADLAEKIENLKCLGVDGKVVFLSGLGYSQEQIGKILGLGNQSNVSRRYKKALEKLA